MKCCFGLCFWSAWVVGTLKAFLDPLNYRIVNVGCRRADSDGACLCKLLDRRLVQWRRTLWRGAWASSSFEWRRLTLPVILRHPCKVYRSLGHLVAEDGRG